MNRYRVNLNGKEMEVAVRARTGSSLSLVIEGNQYDVDVQAILEKPRAAARTEFVADLPAARPVAAAASSSGTVAAPMPGIIVSIPVKAGDAVKRGQTVAVMEAMKMENSIAATRDGIVKEVHVAAGQEVNNGQALVTVE